MRTKPKVRDYGELTKEFMELWDAAAELAKEIAAHPDNPLHKPAKKASKPRRKQTRWPKELAV